MSAPRKGPLKRPFNVGSKDASMSMTTRCTRSITSLLIFREGDRTRSGLILAPLSLSPYHGGIDPGSVEDAIVGAV